ncbi:hypothetical protein THASP1DRAFT_26553 [Thamnocephalis sphaerospora]|uniref:FH2 domain-containing protein n=1 Tax=Thamnocephalis sphaerospora TaxID=78915 RepID=A0A4P9XGU6_9FUNG|nr:hypothetical protein THASP1DRAFT_26553 [Thamnocephalis sphaerospora]|eukprot:RKP04875.1 hypothetical protein THASP1DRAFT_26553 [Thamnocephalis sphaerospora]
MAGSSAGGPPPPPPPMAGSSAGGPPPPPPPPPAAGSSKSSSPGKAPADSRTSSQTRSISVTDASASGLASLPATPTSATGGMPTKLSKYSAKSKLKPMQLDKLSAAAWENTIWARELERREMDEDMFGKQFDEFGLFDEVEKHFGATTFAPKPKPKEEEKVKKISVLDAKRSQNINIVLGRMKGCKPAEIREAILNVDHPMLTEPLLAQMQNLIPTNEECIKLKKYKNTPEVLASADAFFLEIMNIDRYAQRLHAMHFRRTFEERFLDLSNAIDAVTNASVEVEKTRTFPKILEMILMLGNFMNGRGFRGNAQAIKIHSINRLTETKASDGKTTLLHFLATTIDQKFPELLAFTTEFTRLADARRVVFSELNKDYSEMKIHIVEVLSELEAHHKITGKPQESDAFGIIMKISFGERVAASAKSRFDNLDGRFHEMRTVYEKAVTLYGEDPKSTSPHEFFDIFYMFIQSFKNAQKDNFDKLEREERQERRRKAEEERAQELANRKQQKEAEEDETEDKGAMESLLESLRKGSDMEKTKRKRGVRGTAGAGAGAGDKLDTGSRLTVGGNDAARRISVSVRTREMLKEVSATGFDDPAAGRSASTRRRAERRKVSISGAS